MKLSRHVFQTFWDVHAWAGVLAGLVLHVMFFAGVFALFRGELAAWQDPATVIAPERARLLMPATERMIERVVAEHGLAGAMLDVQLATPERPVVAVSWADPGTFERRTVRLDPHTGNAVPERSRLAEFLFHLHFLWHDDMPQLLWVAGLLGVAMLLVLVTGLVIHLPALGRQLFRFRSDRGARSSWSGLHKVLGTWGLPAQAMFAFTGAFMCLSELLLPRFVGPVFGGDRGAAELALYGNYLVAPARGEPGAKPPGATLEELLARAEAAAAMPLADMPSVDTPSVDMRSTGMRADRLRIHHWGDADSTVVVYGSVPAGLYPHAMVKLRARDGAVLHAELPGALPAAQSLSQTLYGLHFARYGGIALTLLYALLGLAGCATILSGNAIWLARREHRRAHAGNRLLARLTALAGGGLAVSTAALFAANRLLPLDWPMGPDARANLELHVFAGTCAAAAASCLLARDLRALWARLLGAAGALFILVPVLGLCTRPLGLLDIGAVHGRPVAIVDALLLGLGAALFAAAWRAHGSLRGSARACRSVLLRPPGNPTAETPRDDAK